MATIRDITAMCKAGNLTEAYELAKANYEESPSNIWTQRGVGWVIYYLIKEDVETRNG